MFNEGRVAEATVHMADALRIDRARLEASHPALISATANVGLLYYAGERYEDAIPLLQEALMLREQTPGQRGSSHNLTMALAAAQRKSGRLDAAKQTLGKAIANAKESGDAWTLLQTNGERAEQMWARGERKAAYDLAVSLRRGADPADAPPHDDTLESLDAAIERWRRELGRP